MITDQFLQHELLKTSLEATDNYLSILKKSRAAGMVSNNMLHDFSYHMTIAHDALQSLGVLDQHEGYMEKHVQEMLKIHGHRDSIISDLPFAHVPKADFGEVDEAVRPIKIKISEPTPTAQERLYAKQQELRKAKGLPDPEHYKMVAAQKQKELHALKKEDTLKTFTSFIKEEDEDKEEDISEEEIDKMVKSLQWEDIVDLYEDDELVYEPSDDEEEELESDSLEEKLSVQARLKKRQAFMRFKGKRNVARGMKLRRASSMNVLKKRAVVAARRAVYQRFLKGRDKSTLSATEKDRIEQQVGRMKFMQAAIATKMLPKMRSIEQKRLAGYRNRKSTAPGGTKSSKAPGGTKNTRR